MVVFWSCHVVGSQVRGSNGVLSMCSILPNCATAGEIKRTSTSTESARYFKLISNSSSRRGGCRRDGCWLVSRRLPSTWEIPAPDRHRRKNNMSSMSSDELTTWLSGLKRGDARAIEQIWQEYFGKL